MNTMQDSPEETTTKVREKNFDADGPQDIEITLKAGSVDVLLTDEPGITVRVRARPEAGNPWAEGLSQLFSWVSQVSESQIGMPIDDAIDRTEITYSEKK